MFFEIDVIFFSTDIEKLSLLLHIMAMLDFPFNELNKIQLINNGEFLNLLLSNIENKESSFMMYGINSIYKEHYNTRIVSGNYHVIYNLDVAQKSKTIIKVVQPKNNSKEKNSQIEIIEKVISKSVRNNSKESKVFSQYIIQVKKNLDAIEKKYKGESYISKNGISQEKNNKNKKVSQERNNKIQKEMFNFVFNILYQCYHLFYKNNSALSEGLMKGEKKKIFFQNVSLLDSFSPTDKCIFQMLINNVKVRTFFIYIEEQFIEEEINHIPFLFTEELLHLKAIDFIDNIEQYSLDSMKFLFQSNITSSSTVTTNNSNSTTPLANKVPLDNSYSISFISFYKFYKENWSKFFIREGNYTKVIQTVIESAKINCFRYRIIEFDNVVLII